MSVLNIDSLLAGDRLKNRITLMGVELEGGWANPPADFPIERDGSVQIPQPSGVRLLVGEIPSPAKVPVAMWGWIKKYYPSHVNNTCGFHVHMSFGGNNHLYQVLMVKDYQDTMMEYLKRWAKEENFPDTHPIWSRLSGENRYCTLDFWPDEQAKQAHKSYNHDRPGHRYTAINYCFSKDKCKTVECRVLPMLDNADQAIRAAKRVLDITNACLVMLACKEVKHSEVISLGKFSQPYSERSIELIER